MANPKAGFIVCLGALSGCFGIGLFMLQSWTLPPQSRSSSSPLISPRVLPKIEKRIKDVPINPPLETRQRIGPGVLHRYSFTLAAGQFLDVVVEQEGVDVTILPLEPSGRKLPMIDSRVADRGPEEIHLFARTAGLYRLEIDSGEQTGSYQFRVKSLRIANDRDRLEARTEELFHHARALARQQNREATAQAFEEFIGTATAWDELDNKRRQADALERAAELSSKNTKKEVQTLTLRRQALHLYEAINDVSSVGRMLNWVGKSYGLLGRVDREKEYYGKALKLAREHKDKIGEATALENQGDVWLGGGENWRALKTYENSLRLWHELGIKSEQITLLNKIGLIYASLGEVEKSLESYQQAYRLLSSGSAAALRAQIETRLAEAWEKKGNWDEALTHARLALDLRQANKDRRGEGVVLAGMSLSYQGRGEFRQAREAQEQALSIFRRWGEPEDVTNASVNLGVILLRQENAQQAVVVLESALDHARKQGLQGAEAVALHALARARRQNPIIARSYAEQAISIMETVRWDAVRDDLKANYLAAKRDCYDILVDILLLDPPAYSHGESIARAFEVSEQRKARNLLDSLVSTRPPMSPEDLAARRRLQNEIEHYEAEMERLKLRDVSLKPLQQAQAERLEQLRDLDALSQAQQGEPSAPMAVSLKKAQELLDDRTLLLVYHLGAEHSFLWLVSPGGAEVYVLPREREIEPLARKFHELLATSQKSVSEKEALIAAKDLGRMLLGPVVGRLENRRLVIVPDGALHYVPFGALLEGPPQTRLRSGYPGSPRLFERHEVLSLPSVSVMAALRERKKRQAQFRGDLVLFAAPVFQEGQYEDLPNTRTEARVIRKLVPPGTRFVEKLGYEATKEAAMSGLLSEFNTVHFATHGTIDTEHPELTAIVLNQVNRQGVSQDGYLRVHDIGTLKIPADLVVLSACKTALGKEMRAEGLVGLTQSFFHAGSSSVLVSLWNVDDKSTPEFMEVFYRGLYVEHRSPAEALRAAQSWMSKHPLWHSPYYWAGFVLQGEWR